MCVFIYGPALAEQSPRLKKNTFWKKYTERFASNPIKRIKPFRKTVQSRSCQSRSCRSPSCQSRMSTHGDARSPPGAPPLFVKQRRTARGPGTPSVSRLRALRQRRGACAKPWWSFPSTRPTPGPSHEGGLSSAVPPPGAPAKIADPFFLCHGHALMAWLSVRFPNPCFQLLYAEAVAGRYVTLEEAPGRKT